MDDIPTYKQGDDTKYQFSGKRIHRGLYKSRNGTVMNADINGASNILRKEYTHAFDNVKDFTYLYETTFAIGYKDLYNNAKAMDERPDGYRYHKAGFGSKVRRKYRKQSRMEYCKLFGKSKFVWMTDKRDKTQAEHAA